MPEFGKKYEREAHMQHKMGEDHLRKLIAMFQEKFPNKDAALNCLDIGCGGGVTTIRFYEELQKLGYTNIKITGLDISAAQIATAKQQLSQLPEMSIDFIRGDALQLDEHVVNDSFDCVFSFFTFHWIDNKKELSLQITKSMKAQGLLFYLTVTALDEWCTIRKALLEELAQDQEWAPYFKDLDITPFAQYSVSEEAFAEDFEILSSEPLDEMLNYTEEKFRNFLKSWLPEIRELRAKLPEGEQDNKINLYLDKLLNMIPEEKTSAVYKSGEGAEQQFHFRQYYGVFFGSKKAATEEVRPSVSLAC